MLWYAVDFELTVVSFDLFPEKSFPPITKCKHLHREALVAFFFERVSVKNSGTNFLKRNKCLCTTAHSHRKREITKQVFLRTKKFFLFLEREQRLFDSHLTRSIPVQCALISSCSGTNLWQKPTNKRSLGQSQSEQLMILCCYIINEEEKTI